MDQRRGDALLEVCRRAHTLKLASTTCADTTAGPSTTPDTDTGAAATPGTVVWGRVVPAGVKSTVLVTIGLDDLRQRARPGTLIGGVDGGTVLGPETVRKLACDGNIIPVLLGGTGRSSTSAVLAGPSPPPSTARCGYGTGTAPSPAAPSPAPGPTPTTSGTGPTAGTPTWTEFCGL